MGENIPTRMQAVVVHGPEDYRLEEVDVPRPGPGELLIRVAACGVCRSNLHMIVGDWAGAGLPAISPIVPG